MSEEIKKTNDTDDEKEKETKEFNKKKFTIAIECFRLKIF